MDLIEVRKIQRERVVEAMNNDLEADTWPYCHLPLLLKLLEMNEDLLEMDYSPWHWETDVLSTIRALSGLERWSEVVSIARKFLPYFDKDSSDRAGYKGLIQQHLTEAEKELRNSTWTTHNYWTDEIA